MNDICSITSSLDSDLLILVGRLVTALVPIISWTVIA